MLIPWQSRISRYKQLHAFIASIIVPHIIPFSNKDPYWSYEQSKIGERRGEVRCTNNGMMCETMNDLILTMNIWTRLRNVTNPFPPKTRTKEKKNIQISVMYIETILITVLTYNQIIVDHLKSCSLSTISHSWTSIWSCQWSYRWTHSWSCRKTHGFTSHWIGRCT